jgi:hypothetical protein
MPGMKIHAEAVLPKFQLLPPRRCPAIIGDGMRGDAGAGNRLGILLGAAALRPLFDNADTESALRQIGRDGGAVVSSSYDYYVISFVCSHTILLLNNLPVEKRDPRPKLPAMPETAMLAFSPPNDISRAVSSA